MTDRRTTSPDTGTVAAPRGALPARPRLIALLLLTGTGALSTDMYLAALPDVALSLRTTETVASLSITAYIVGSAVGQLGAGPLSDARGRRVIALVASSCFAAATIAAGLAPSGWTLVAARLVAGVAGGAGIAVGRAVVSDVARGRAAAALFGTLSAVSLIAPVVAPVLGGLLLGVGGWRASFWFLAAVGVAMWVAAATGLPETLPLAARAPGGTRALARRTAALLRDPRFRAPLVVQCLTVAGFFVYIGGSSFVLQDGLDIDAAQYTLVFTTNAVTMVLASVAFRAMVRRHGALVLRNGAIVVQSAGVLCLLAVAVVVRTPPLAAVWAALAVMTTGLGAFLPASAALTQHAGRRYAGTASALGGGLPFLVGAATTPLTGLLGTQTVPVMAGCMAVLFAAALAAALTTRATTVDVDDDATTPGPRDGHRAGERVQHLEP